MTDLLVSYLASSLRIAAPLLFVAYGGLLSERSGVVNIALEGMMLIGAFAAAAGAYFTHSPWIGLACAGGAGALFGLIHAVGSIYFRANQIVSGVAINLLAVGATPFFCKILFDSTSQSPGLPIGARFVSAPLGLAVLLVLVMTYLIRSTVAGLRLSFAGEHPEALEAAGISVRRTRLRAVLLSGFLAGIGGGFLSVYLSSGFSRNMTAGRGFMALAALILGKWRPLPTAAACLFFGLTEAIQMRLQGIILWGTEPVPFQFVQMIPYVVTVLVLAGAIGESHPPKALGAPFPTY